MNKNWQKAMLYPWIGAIAFPIAFLPYDLYRGIFPTDGPLSGYTLLLIVALFIILTAIILTFVNYIHIETDSKSLKVYLMISAENWNNDVFISHDFKERMYEQFKKDGINAKIVVPNIYYRTHFNRRLIQYDQKGLSYCKTGDWLLMQKYMLKGHIFIFGEIRERTSNGAEKYIISNQRLVVSCDENASDETIKHLENSLNMEALNYQIDKRYEEEQINDISLLFVDLTEYLVGITHLICGDYSKAYLLHSKLCKRVHPRKRANIYKDLDSCLNEEISLLVVYDIRNNKIEEAGHKLKSHISMFSSSVVTAALEAQILICSSKDSVQCKQNAQKALSLLESLKTADTAERSLILYNRAYLHLLLEQYAEANKRYRAANKYSQANHLISILEYCDYVLRSPEKLYEHTTAEYVKAYALYKLHRFEAAHDSLCSVLMNNDEGSFYYAEALKMFLTLPQLHDNP